MADSIRIREGFPGQRLVVVPRDVVRLCRSLPVIQDLHVLAIGSFPSARHHYVARPAGLPETILIHCTHGRGWCRMGEREWVVDEGKAIFVPPGQPHLYGADPQTPWSINWVHFGGRRTPAYLNILGVSLDQPLLNLPGAPALIQAFEELYGLLRMGYTETSLLGLSTELGRYLGMFKLYQRAFYHKGRQAEGKILESMAFMREHLGESLRLEALAEQAGMSMPHYCGLFKQQTGTSPIIYFIRLKMQQACELLTATGLPVAAIGRQIGYADQFYFCRIFRKTIGMAPTTYRQTIKPAKPIVLH